MSSIGIPALTIDLKGQLDENVAKARVRKLVGDGLEAAVRYWRDARMLAHFERSAHGIYGYPARTRNTNARKARRSQVRSQLASNATSRSSPRDWVLIPSPRPVRDLVDSGDALALLTALRAGLPIAVRHRGEGGTRATMPINLQPLIRGDRFWTDLRVVGQDIAPLVQAAEKGMRDSIAVAGNHPFKTGA